MLLLGWGRVSVDEGGCCWGCALEVGAAVAGYVDAEHDADAPLEGDMVSLLSVSRRKKACGNLRPRKYSDIGRSHPRQAHSSRLRSATPEQHCHLRTAP